MAQFLSFEDFEGADRLYQTHPKVDPNYTSEEALKTRAREMYIEEVERITARAHEMGVATVDVRIIDAALEVMGRKVPE